MPPPANKDAIRIIFMIFLLKFMDPTAQDRLRFPYPLDITMEPKPRIGQWNPRDFIRIYCVLRLN